MNTLHALVVAVDGSTRLVDWERTETGSVVAHLQDAVGGFFDVVSLAPDLDMWISDTGLIDGLDVNEAATYEARRHGLTHQPYFGPVVFTGGIDSQGESLSLGASREAQILGTVADLLGVPE